MPGEPMRQRAPQPAFQPVDVPSGALVRASADQWPSPEQWLLSTHPSPDLARAEWREHGVAMLPLSGLFSAVRLPGRLVQAATASTDPHDVDTALTEAFGGGPVVCDLRGPRYYALVPASVPRTWRDAVADWRCGEVVCLGEGTYLGVPRLDAVDSPRLGSESYWSVPPETAGTLCRPLAVARLIACGTSLLRDEA